jgi:hypothetical protein
MPQRRPQRIEGVRLARFVRHGDEARRGVSLFADYRDDYTRTLFGVSGIDEMAVVMISLHFGAGDRD